MKRLTTTVLALALGLAIPALAQTTTPVTGYMAGNNTGTPSCCLSVPNRQATPAGPEWTVGYSVSLTPADIEAMREEISANLYDRDDPSTTLGFATEADA